MSRSQSASRVSRLVGEQAMNAKITTRDCIRSDVELTAMQNVVYERVPESNVAFEFLLSYGT